MATAHNLVSLLLVALLAFFAIASAANTEQRPVIVSYPKGTPDNIVQEAMDAIKEAGGVITHEYNIIKGFAAKVSDEAVSVVQSMSQGEHAPTIEDDQVVSINN